ncbi:tetratricopeptide repeat-containing sensor histidine kinase [Neolewinella persica]|uniref:tetratricopeptide repeat-containing sensor histidine kinase n=1 Tax=Neolewinella persica TaxID=70998 RepID=UPI00037D81BB|nr:histidine kinase [Neolewinella persica]
MILRFLLLAILLGTATWADAQSAPVKASRSSEEMTIIARASSLRKDDPAEAIRLLNSVIQEQPKADELKKVFLLLGDIYADIGQGALALGRYDRAMEVMSSQDATGRAGVFLKRGTVQLALADYAGARVSFDQCLKLAPKSSTLSNACREGLADLEARSDNFVESQSYYQQVQTAAPDSITQVRVNAKRADVYLQQNDLSNAANSLDQALTQVPRNRQLSKEESKDLIAANSNVRSAVLKDAPRLDNNIVEALPSAPLSLVTSDNFTRFKVLREVGKLREAEDKLEEVLNTVTPETPPEIATAVYAEGTDFFLDRNRPDRAADIYRNYTIANDQLLAQRRDELDQQVAVLREQQTIDLGLKDLRSAEVERQLLNDQVSLQRWLIYLLGALLLGALLSVVLILRSVRKRQRANQALLLRNLQTRMNPHFIFNSLNSINNYIARQDERSANRYLGRFAKLMRNVLDQSGKDFVSLTEELEQLSLYLELEKERFTGKFDYALPASTGFEDIRLPPMILQPFVENAIWHGLRYREEGGQLTVTVVRNNRKVLVAITDNGIGRSRSAALKTKNQLNHQSTGLETTLQRLELINAYYGEDFSVQIGDAFPEEDHVGTRVELTLVQ